MPLYGVQYLESVKPLLEEEKYQEMEHLVKEFKVHSITGQYRSSCVAIVTC